MTPVPATESEFAADLAAGAKLLEARDLAFAIADEQCIHDVETWHYTVVSDGREWRDLKMQSNAEMAERCVRALRYLELRGYLVQHPVFPNLVRVERPAKEEPDVDR